MALHKPELPLSGQHSLPDGYATITRCRRCGIVIGFGDRCELCIDPRRADDDAPGEYRGRHHSDWSPTVDELIIQGDDDEAEFLLLRLIDATVAEATRRGVPPFQASLPPPRADRAAARRHEARGADRGALRGLRATGGRGRTKHDGIGRAEVHRLSERS